MTEPRTTVPALSVAVPVYCEEQGIGEFHRRLVQALERDQQLASWEIVYADDGSTDATPDLLSNLAADDSRVRVISLSRNFGHQAAITAAMEHARGDAIVLIDSDLQDPPEVIPSMVAKWREGYDVVYGQRSQRAGESLFKRATASVFYRLLNRLSEVQCPRDVGDFRLLDRRVVDTLSSMPERSRYLRGMIAWIGFRQCAVVYDREPRFAGVSLPKMLRFAVDATTSFSDKPLRLATRLGMLLIVCAAGLSSWMLIGQMLLKDEGPSGWASLLTVVMMFGGVQLLTIGVLGAYVGRIYQQVQQRPIYIVASDSASPREQGDAAAG